MYILVFKTNIESDHDHFHIKNVLDSHPHINTWHIDRDDIDNVLRIESLHNISHDIISNIKLAGYHCEELPD